MKKSLLRNNEKLNEIYYRNVDTVYRVCFLYTKNEADAQDMTQNTFLRLIEASPAFESSEHEKAWLIRTGSNLCINYLRRKKRTVAFDAENAPAKAGFEIDETLELVLALPPKYKTALYLHYYEGYPAVEIAKMLGEKESTVRGHLHTGRKLLKKEIENETQ